MRVRELVSGAHCLWRDSRIVHRSGPPEDVSFASDDRRITALLYRARTDGPAVLLLHTAFGLTVHERALAIRMAAEGISCAVVRYARRTSGAVLSNAARRAVLESCTAQSLERLADVMRVPANRVGVLGLSLGGHFAIHLASGEARTAPAAVAVWYGVYPATLSCIETLRAPLLIVQGERDREIFVRSAESAACIARKRGVDCDVITYAGAVHQLDVFQSRSAAASNAWEATIRFLRRHLAG